MTKVIGLTGSIATGKSTAAQMLRQLGIAVFDADKAAHALLQPDSVYFDEIAHAFPRAVKENTLCRKTLGEEIFNHDRSRLRLESILHPAIREAEIRFIHQAIARHDPLIVLDIPLLFETGADHLCDSVWVLYCPAFLQRQRALKREAMTEQKYKSILSRQMPQAEKCRRADAILLSGIGKSFMMQQLKQLIKRSRNA